jgi:hypothetical protein
MVSALTEGFQRASLVAAGFSLAAALSAGVLLRRLQHGADPAQAGNDQPDEAPAPILATLTDELNA